MPHYVYLIQIGDVYKIGRTEVQEGLHFNRLRSYPPNSNLILMRQVKGIHIEKQIIDEFTTKFEKVGNSNEYFRGDVNLMVCIVNTITNKLVDDNTSLLDVSDRTFRINVRGIFTSEDNEEFRQELGCLPFGGSTFYWKREGGGEDKIKSMDSSQNFSTAFWTRTGTPLRRLVEFMKVLEVKKFRVLTTEGFMWIDDKLILCDNSIERPRVVLNSVDHFLNHYLDFKKGPDLFVPLDAIIPVYEKFCSSARMYYEDDFAEHCGLRIERIEGDVLWTPAALKGLKHSEFLFRNPLVVRGINMTCDIPDVYTDFGEFLSTWTLPTNGTTTATQVLREYHAQGFPKVRIQIADLFAKFEQYGWSVDPRTAIITPKNSLRT